MTYERSNVLPLIGVGLLAGVLSGFFGVGGGLVVVPFLLLLGFDPRHAAGTSVAAILPTSIVGSVTYGLQGNLDWGVAGLLALGVVIGAQVGTRILARISKDVVFWAFMGFIVFALISLWVVVPVRDSQIEWSVGMGIGLVATGFLAGILSGILGIGGGLVVMPIMMFAFGISDLVAKGSSLLMMVPGSISATSGNVRSGNVDLRAAACIGLAACVASPVGVQFAHLVQPQLANMLFAVFIVGVAIQLIVKQLRSRPAAG